VILVSALPLAGVDASPFAGAAAALTRGPADRASVKGVAGPKAEERNGRNTLPPLGVGRAFEPRPPHIEGNISVYRGQLIVYADGSEISSIVEFNCFECQKSD
jgi:hypothetical protein